MVQEASLTLQALADGGKEPLGTYRKTIWIFSTDPFEGKKTWLKELKLKVHDPGAKARTAKVLKDLELPFEEATRAAELAEVHAGVILVGEGASFKDDPDLFPALSQAALRGVHILCLATGEGSFPFPSREPVLPTPLTFHRQEIIRKLDKRLDALAWPPESRVATSSWNLVAEEGKVMIQTQPHAKGYHWLSWEHPEKKGRMILSTFALLDSWEASPTPRYLLAAILEHLTRQEDLPKKE